VCVHSQLLKNVKSQSGVTYKEKHTSP